MNKALFSTLMHVLELAVVVAVLLVVRYIGLLEGDTQTTIVGLLLAGLAKFSRASELPIPDYVNKP